MKKILFFVALLISATFVAKPTVAAKPANSCAYIKDGTIKDKFADIINLGYNNWGYNYEAHMFNGKYCDAYGNADWCQQFKDVSLMMKWNDAWLSNKDCGTQSTDQLAFTSLTNPDTVLDRHYPTNSYIGSGAWLTNHATGTYTSATAYHWNLDGKWVLEFNSTLWPSGNPYAHNLTITGVTATGSSTGNTYTTTISISGDSITIVATYEPGSAVYPYTYTAIGTISAGGLSGTWSDTLGDSGAWSSTSGTANKVYDVCTVSDFVKIVAVPTDATTIVNDVKCPDNLWDGNKLWKTADGNEIGCSIWGSFAIIQEIASDPCDEYGVINYMSPIRKGLGNW